MAGAETLVLATNGGVHPPDRLAAFAASQIGALIAIDAQSVSADAAAARKALPLFKIAVADAVEPYIASVYQAEQANVVANPLILRHDPFNIDSFIAGASTDVVSAADGTPFAAPIQANSDAFIATVGKILAQVFIDAANVQRSTSLDAAGR